MRDQQLFGFRFWLSWILWFAVSFVIATLFWTVLIHVCFGELEGAELTFSWSVAVFGSWFILLIPFMRKKEQIWKRLNQDQEQAVDAWLTAMQIFIGLLILACFFWNWKLEERTRLSPAFDPIWQKAVFVSWLFLLIPFLILMYRKADEIFKTACDHQVPSEPVFQRAVLQKSKRFLTESIVEKLKETPFTLRGGHLVTAVLKNGERVLNVFVVNCHEIIGVYDRLKLGFEGSEVSDVEVVCPDKLPPYQESKWLKLDENP